MRQFLATLALIAAVTAAPLGAYCEWQCARESAPSQADAAMSHCHEMAGADIAGTTVIAGLAQCDGHGAAPAITEARRAAGPAFVLIAATRDAGLDSRTALAVAADHRLPPDISPPDTVRPAVLRI